MAVTQVTAAALCERVFFPGLRIKGHGGDRLAQGSFTLTCLLGQKLGLPPSKAAHPSVQWLLFPPPPTSVTGRLGCLGPKSKDDTGAGYAQLHPVSLYQPRSASHS